jgi:diguanylate cyclase (GGDEF)-like protein
MSSRKALAQLLLNGFQRVRGCAAEPQILFPFIAAILLAATWGTTFSLIRLRLSAADSAAALSSRELLGTYEAQVVRVLGEVDQTLKLVKYWHERENGGGRLADLQAKGVLPPALVFAISVADRYGNIVDSTDPTERQNISEQDYFRRKTDSDAAVVARLPRGPTGEAKLRFARRLETNGRFDGVVIVAIEAAFFVSGYEPGKLGQHGVLGLLGTDGIFRVKQTGESITSGESSDYRSRIETPDAIDSQATLSMNSWDGVWRWTSAREVYGFPLAVMVGLSADEQLAPARHDVRNYVWRAALGSVIAILVTILLGRTTWQLAQSRLRESEVKITHAQRLEYLAYHDGLTGLPNRSLFSKLLSQSISDARRYGKRLIVAFLDLDRFKHINDTLGHEAGDHLLQEMADRLKACVRESDTIARLGGDEFVVLLPVADAQFAATVAQKILSSIARPVILIGHEFRVTASIGISVYPHDGLDEQTLTKNADIAMYQAKEQGKNNYQFYSPKLNADSLERLALEASLRHALERNEFRLHYQAKRDIATGTITGMEALLRWEHPDLGTIVPLQFIPLAEATGLILPIGRWVLRTACSQNVAWQSQGLRSLSIAVNLTPRQFCDPHLLEDVTSILHETGLEPRLLELEISESLLIRDVADALRTLTRLKELGIRIAIDDFGTGYSSLAMLKNFPLDTIKIDRSFVRDLAREAGDTALTDAIIAMGKSLSLTVVAQGVETREQAEYLRTHACDELQGFYFSRPLPAEQFTQLLLAQSTATTFSGKAPVLKLV